MENNNSIILFDDTCNLCNRSVRFILQNDRRKIFMFAGLSTGFSKKTLKDHNLQNSDTVILLENNHLYFKSTAILRIVKHFRNAWSVLYCLIIIPGPIRDFFYDYIARNRGRWFGRTDRCELYEKEEKGRFL